MRPAFNHNDDMVGRCAYCDAAQYDDEAVDCWKCDQPWKDTEEVPDAESESE